MNLPLEYVEKMKALLGEEYDDYIASFDEGRFYGLRANTLKISAEELQE
ncbi:MAG: SAM-dependent methyltransferase, partial [Anaerotignum sp.]|nr:SAM-dependent methyltransferase [Anaerotignum sp.]